MSNMGLFKCETSFKTYKTKNGLIRHHNAKHVVTEINNIKPTQYGTSTPTDVMKTAVNTVSHDNLIELLKKILEDLSVDECFTTEPRDAMKKYNFRDTDNELLLAIKKIYEKYIKRCDVDEYYSVFYSDIVISCSSYFKELRPQLCTLVVTRLADKVLHFSHREPNLTKVSHINPISEKELNRLQYLAGYVVFKLLKKTEKCKECNSPENQYTVRILAGMRTEDFADQKLIHSLNRGELYAVTPECQALFHRAKKHFRIETNVTSINRVNIEQITKSLMKDKDLISTYNSIVLKLKVTKK